jgi:hypothetical protein
MTAEFDPYHKWLGISPREQPPTHYRLLGIEPFEPDPDVISNAADQRMTHIRSLQSGQRAALSQKLLNEISAARLCLLDPQAKAAYDATLRAAQDVPLAAAPEPLVTVDTHSNTRPKGGFPLALLAVGVAVVLLSVAVAGAIIVMQKEDAKVAVDNSETPTTPQTPKHPVEQTPAQPTDEDANAPGPSDDESPQSPAGDDGAAAINTQPPDTPSSITPSTGDDSPKDEPPVKTTPPKEPSPPETAPPQAPPAESPPKETPRLAVPAADELTPARQLVKEVYQSEYDAAKDDPQKLSALAQAMLRQAGEAAVEPSNRFALLQTSADMAARGGNVALAWQAYGDLKQHFEIDVAPQRLRMIEGVAEDARPANQNKTVAQQMLLLVDDATAADDYDAATALADAAVSLARKARDLDLVKQAVAVGKEIEPLAARYNREVKPALAVLKTNPDDPAANLAVGKYLVLVKGDWQRALPMLAKATLDTKFHPAAKQELDAEGDKIRAADAWYDLAQQQQDEAAKNRLLVHARELYKTNVAALSGLEKTRVERRIEELAAIAAPAGPEPAAVAASTPAPKPTAPKPTAPRSATPKPKRGEGVPVKVVGSANYYGEVRINGTPLFAAPLGRDEPTTVAAALKAGDLITASISNRSHANSLWVVFVNQENEFLFETSPAWKSYRPPNTASWWNIDVNKLAEVAPAEAREPDTPYLDRVQRSVGTVLQRLRIAQPIHSTLPGPTERDPEFVFYVVQPEDLLPKPDKMYSPADDKGLFPRPEQGERLPVRVVAAGNNRIRVFVNGQPVYPRTATRDRAIVAQTRLREGDLIVVEIDDRFDVSSARVVFLTASGKHLFETSTDWTAFQAPDPIRWWDLYREKPKETAPAELREADVQYVDQVQQAIQKALPGLPSSPPIYSPLRGEKDRAYRHIYYVVKKGDLVPER